MNFKQFTLAAAILSQSLSGDSVTQKNPSLEIEESDLFRVEYNVQGRLLGLFPIENKEVYIEKIPYGDEGYLVKGRLDLRLNFLIKKTFDLESITQLDHEGNTLMSLGIERNGKDKMNAKTDSLLDYFSSRGLIENPSEVTSLNHESYNYEDNQIRYTGEESRDYGMGEVDNFLISFLDYMENIEYASERETISTILGGELRDVEIYKEESSEGYSVTADFEGVKDLNRIELYLSKENNTSLPERVSGRISGTRMNAEMTSFKNGNLEELTRQ